MHDDQINPQHSVKELDREQELKPLVGLPMRHIDRDALWLELHFGEVREIPLNDGGVELLGEWKVEVYGPCAWRISKPGQIVLASGDLSQSPAGDDRSLVGRSQLTRFGLVAYFLQNEIAVHPPVVESIEMDGVQGFTMKLNMGYKFSVFVMDSESPTHPCYWRVSNRHRLHPLATPNPLANSAVRPRPLTRRHSRRIRLLMQFWGPVSRHRQRHRRS